MAEKAEDIEVEAAGGEPRSADMGAAALAVALSGRPGGTADLELDAFLKAQTRLAELQSEHLHEQRELALSRLRWGRFGDRMKALLQVMTAMVGLLAAALVGSLAWQAHEAHGLAIEAFSVPPELARNGLTGQVAASRFLDRLQALQMATANSDRPGQSYESDWGTDFKVEIPETGLSLSEIQKLLRERLGHVSHVTGEVMLVGDSISVTARMGEEPPKTFTGPIADFDALEQKAAEAVYRASQPYRYAEYLSKQNRIDEAVEVLTDLAQHGPTSERGWAYAELALIDLNNHGNARAARQNAALGQGFGKGSDINDMITQVNVAVWSGDEEGDLADSRWLAAMTQERLPDTSPLFYAENKLLAHDWLTFLQADYATSAAGWMQVPVVDGESHFARLAPAMAATADALGHDLPAARKVLVAAAGAPDAALTWDVATGAFTALPRFWFAAEQGRWDLALADVRAVDAALESGKSKLPIYGLMQSVWTRPLEALALAHTGDLAAAEALIATTPDDCYPCLRARALIATEARDYPSAERWSAAAVRRAPSVPLAYADWGRARLAKGDPDGAIAELRRSVERAPRFADPVETWGEALAAKGDFAGADAKFKAAAALAPHWGRVYLKEAEALARLGRRDQARQARDRAAGMDLTAAERSELTALAV